MGTATSSVYIRDGDSNVTVSTSRTRPHRYLCLDFGRSDRGTFYIWHGKTLVAGPCVLVNVYAKDLSTSPCLSFEGTDSSIHTSNHTLDHGDYKITYKHHMTVGCGPPGTLVSLSVVKYK
jgi:hypothetical protein